MKYCHKCGKKLADNAKVCVECGYEFEPTQVEIVNKKKKGSWGWLIFWFIFTGIGGFIYFFIRDWSGK